MLENYLMEANMLHLQSERLIDAVTADLEANLPSV